MCSEGRAVAGCIVALVLAAAACATRSIRAGLAMSKRLRSEDIETVVKLAWQTQAPTRGDFLQGLTQKALVYYR